MALRMMQITVPVNPDHDQAGRLDEIIGDHSVLARFSDDRDEANIIVQLLVKDDETETLMDACEDAFSTDNGLRIVLTPVEAILPRPDPDEEDESAENGEDKKRNRLRVSREELYADITDGLGAWQTFVAMAVLSTIVAAVGLIEDDVAVVIGAMVIAPLLSPNVAQALATALGDVKLGLRAMLRNALGIGIAFGIAALIGSLIEFDPYVDAIRARTDASLGSVALALAAGAAGTLAYTMGLSGAVIGVMVAVALLPPLVVCGLLTGAQEWRAATGAGVLTMINVICINLAGMATFYVQGVRPRTWYEAETARKALWVSAPLWITLLAILIGVLFFSDFALEMPESAD